MIGELLEIGKELVYAKYNGYIPLIRRSQTGQVSLISGRQGKQNSL